MDEKISDVKITDILTSDLSQKDNEYVFKVKISCDIGVFFAFGFLNQKIFKACI